MVKPGEPVRGSNTGRPIMALLDLLGQRWTLRILWELRQGGLTFRQLQSNCGDISPSVLNRRLQELKEAALVHTVEREGYQLTELGVELLQSLKPLNDWAARWSEALRSEET